MLVPMMTVRNHCAEPRKLIFVPPSAAIMSLIRPSVTLRKLVAMEPRTTQLMKCGRYISVCVVRLMNLMRISFSISASRMGMGNVIRKRVMLSTNEFTNTVANLPEVNS